MFDLCMYLFDSNCQVGRQAVDLGLVRLKVWPGGLKASIIKVRTLAYTPSTPP